MDGREKARLMAEELCLEAEYDDECDLCIEDGFDECQGHLYDEEHGTYVPTVRANQLIGE